MILFKGCDVEAFLLCTTEYLTKWFQLFLFVTHCLFPKVSLYYNKVVTTFCLLPTVSTLTFNCTRTSSSLVSLSSNHATSNSLFSLSSNDQIYKSPFLLSFNDSNSISLSSNLTSETLSAHFCRRLCKLQLRDGAL